MNPPPAAPDEPNKRRRLNDHTNPLFMTSSPDEHTSAPRGAGTVFATPDMRTSLLDCSAYTQSESEDHGYMSQSPPGTISPQDVADASTNDKPEELDDEDEDEDEEEAGYDEFSEPLPHHAAFDADLQDLLKENKEVLEQLLETAKSFSGSVALQNMAAKAKAALQDPSFKRPTIALVGSTAAGKFASLLIVTAR